MDRHARLGGNHVLAGHLDARPRGSEAQSVVAALHHIAVEAAQRKRHVAVRTSILHRHGGAGLRPVKDDGLADDRALEDVALHLRGIGGDLPAIGQEHRSP